MPKPFALITQPYVSLVVDQTIMLKIKGRRLDTLTEVMVVGVRGASRSDPPTIATIVPGTEKKNSVIISFVVPDAEFWRDPRDTEELEITVTNADGSDTTVYP